MRVEASHHPALTQAVEPQFRVKNGGFSDADHPSAGSIEP
jgi:hypothetical protein